MTAKQADVLPTWRPKEQDILLLNQNESIYQMMVSAGFINHQMEILWILYQLTDTDKSWLQDIAKRFIQSSGYDCSDLIAWLSRLFHESYL